MMTNELEKQHLSHLQQLDDVLNYISSKGNSITDREKHFREISKGSWEVIPDSNDKYNLSYEFLVSEDFITKTDGGYRMNYKGLMKLGSKSFVKTYEIETRNSNTAFNFWKYTPWFTGIAAITSSVILIGELCGWWKS